MRECIARQRAGALGAGGILPPPPPSRAHRGASTAPRATLPPPQGYVRRLSQSSSRRCNVQTLLLKVLSRCNAWPLKADHHLHHTALCCALLPPTVGSLRPNARLSPQPSSYWLSSTRSLLLLLPK